MDEEVRRITDECHAEARRLLRENRNRLDATVAELGVEGILRRSYCGPSRWLASDAGAS
jgi:ATP-dependent Zn protease